MRTDREREVNNQRVESPHTAPLPPPGSDELVLERRSHHDDCGLVQNIPPILYPRAATAAADHDVVGTRQRTGGTPIIGVVVPRLAAGRITDRAAVGGRGGDDHRDVLRLRPPPPSDHAHLVDVGVVVAALLRRRAVDRLRGIIVALPREDPGEDTAGDDDADDSDEG
jgi:hypothetical protein